MIVFVPFNWRPQGKSVYEKSMVVFNVINTDEVIVNYFHRSFVSFIPLMEGKLTHILTEIQIQPKPSGEVGTSERIVIIITKSCHSQGQL